MDERQMDSRRIYAPELVVFTAWRQWSSARVLDKIVAQSTAIDDSQAGNKARRCSWSRTHSFFASTGGFAFDCTPYIAESSPKRSPTRFLPSGTPQRLTITARGLAFLARCGILPDVPREDIDDKSKSNQLAKSLVVLQASWMLLQVVGRLWSHLPVTLLEVNTVAHVFCAFSMYLMWWNKPLTPTQPIILRGEWVSTLLPFMYLSSEVSGTVDINHLKSQTMIKTLFASWSLYSKAPEIESICYREKTGIISSAESEASTVEAANEDHRDPCRPISEGCKPLLKARRVQTQSGSAFFERRPRVTGASCVAPSADSSALDRRMKLSTIFGTHPKVVASQIAFQHDIDDEICIHFKSEEMVVSSSRNWPSDELLRDVGGLVVGMILWLANLLYGGIHAAAWNEYFPSVAEKWLWRASATYIGFCGGLWVVTNFFVSSYPPLNDFWERWMAGEKTWLQNVSLGTLVFICGSSLVFARAYIVVEAFVSIRRLPASAYETPSWVAIFPHL